MTCRLCKQDLETGRDYAQAFPEFAQHFPRMPREDGHPICDGCYQDMLGMVSARMLGPLAAEAEDLIDRFCQASNLPRQWLELSDTQVEWVKQGMKRRLGFPCVNGK